MYTRSCIRRPLLHGLPFLLVERRTANTFHRESEIMTFISITRIHWDFYKSYSIYVPTARSIPFRLRCSLRKLRPNVQTGAIFIGKSLGFERRTRYCKTSDVLESEFQGSPITDVP